MTTFLAIAEISKLEYLSFKSKAIGKLEIVDWKYMMSEVVLMPIVKIKDVENKEHVERVFQKSEINCLI